MNKQLDIEIWQKFARGWVAQHISNVIDELPPLTSAKIASAKSVVFDDDDDDDDDI